MFQVQSSRFKVAKPGCFTKTVPIVPVVPIVSKGRSIALVLGVSAERELGFINDFE